MMADCLRAGALCQEDRWDPCCSLEEEILTILEDGVPVTVRYLCAIVYPTRSWCEAQRGAAEVVRGHCLGLVRRRVLVEIEEDTFSLAAMGRA
jgi:hypothetical protein